MRWCAEAQKPAILCSFGKDSLVIVHLTRELGLKLPIIYHRNHWFPEKNAFADRSDPALAARGARLAAERCAASRSTIRQLRSSRAWPARPRQGCIQTVKPLSNRATASEWMYLTGSSSQWTASRGYARARIFLIDRRDILRASRGICVSTATNPATSDIFEGPCPLRADRSPASARPAPSDAFPLKPTGVIQTSGIISKRIPAADAGQPLRCRAPDASGRR
jgi:hypothetical protein